MSRLPAHRHLPLRAPRPICPRRGAALSVQVGLAVLSTLVLAACGGSSQQPTHPRTGSTPTSTRPPSAPTAALTVRPGVGLGAIRMGESRTVIRDHSVPVSSGSSSVAATYTTPGGTINVNFDPHGHAEIIASSSPTLAIYGWRLSRDQRRILRRMRAQGWTVARCLHGAVAATEKAHGSGVITRIVWPGRGRAVGANPTAGVYPADRTFPGEFGCPGSGGRQPL